MIDKKQWVARLLARTKKSLCGFLTRCYQLDWSSPTWLPCLAFASQYLRFLLAPLHPRRLFWTASRSFFLCYWSSSYYQQDGGQIPIHNQHSQAQLSHFDFWGSSRSSPRRQAVSPQSCQPRNAQSHSTHISIMESAFRCRVAKGRSEERRQSGRFRHE